MLKLLRLLRGYVDFTALGKHTERFINILNFRGIQYWDFEPVGDIYSGKMFVSDYLKIRTIAKNASVKLRVRQRHGLPFFIRKRRHRAGILAGAVLGAVILFVLSQFIWSIRIVGAESLSTSRLTRVFAENGFEVGMPKSSLDVNKLERNIELEIPEIRWLSVNALNNIAIVEIKEKAKTPKLNDKKYPCNIKSDSDGVITDIVVRKGTCEVKKGSAVARNQLLVNCVVKSRDEKQSLVHSDAEIYADIVVNKTIKIPKENYNLKIADEYTEKSDFTFLWFRMPLMLSNSLGDLSVRRRTENKLRVNDVSLPFGSVSERTYYFTPVKRTLGDRQIKSLFNTRLNLYEAFNCGDCTVKSRDTKLVKTSDEYIYSTSLTVNKNIAAEQRVKVN